MPSVTLSMPRGRTPGDCFRIAVTLAYGQAYGFDYDSTPGDAFANGGEQMAGWRNWAAIRGLGWWESREIGPLASPWLAIVDSPGGYASHAVIMDGQRLYADPANHFTRIGPRDVRRAMMLLPASDPFWSGSVNGWLLPKPYRDDWQIGPGA